MTTESLTDADEQPYRLPQLHIPEVGSVTARALLQSGNTPRQWFESGGEGCLQQTDWPAVERDLSRHAQTSHHAITLQDAVPAPAEGNRRCTAGAFVHGDAGLRAWACPGRQPRSLLSRRSSRLMVDLLLPDA